MNKVILSLIITALSINAFSQKVYFVYLQSEAEQPFILRLNNKSLNSSKSGYLILSKLKDSSYSFSIIFPENKWAEQNFSVIISARDHGYLLKNFSGKGWGLYDLQTSVVQMSKTNEVSRENVVINKEVSKFTEILANAVDDSTLKQKLPPQVEEVKKAEDIVAPAEIAKITFDSTAKQQPATSIAEVKNSEVVLMSAEKKDEPKAILPGQEVKLNEEKKIAQDSLIEEKKISTRENEIAGFPVLKVNEPDSSTSGGFKKSKISRKSESSTTEGFGLIFIDEYEDGTRDTISILIPNQYTLVKELISEPQVGKSIPETKVDTVNSSMRNDTIEIRDKIMKEEPVVKTEMIPVTPGINKCSLDAGETDFLDLRKKMALALNDDGMMEEARQYFKIKCFTTAQIRNLGFLFLNDEGKYRFFDIAYSSVSDTGLFSSLQSELKDEYYINRFKSMLRN